MRQPRTTNQELRTELGIPEDAFVVGCVGAVRKGHKRMDYLITEFAKFSDIRVHPPSLGGLRRTGLRSLVLRSRFGAVGSAVPFLLIAGAREDQSDEVIKLARETAGGRIKILFDVPSRDMPDVYRAMDVFVLCSLEEMFGICFLEAMASGVPCIGNRHPVTEWILGAESTRRAEDRGQRTEWKDETAPNSEPRTAAAGGACIDMSREGELAGFLAGLTPEWVGKHGKQARERAEKMFSKEAVYPQFMEMYKAVAEAGQGLSCGMSACKYITM